MHNIDTPIIDLNLGAKILGMDQTAAKKMISAMLENAEADMGKLAEAYKTKKWAELLEFVHKLHGSTAYCGTPRLREACSDLEKCLKLDQQNLIEERYHKMIQELELVKQEHKP